MEGGVHNHTTEEGMHVGSFLGHVVPGSMFLWVSLYSSIQMYHHYFSARTQHGNYAASHARPYWFCKKSKFKQIEAIIRLMLITSGILGEIITSYDGETKKFINQMMHAEHIAMFAGFGFATAVDILMYHKCGCLPDGSDYFCGFAAYAVEFILFAYHLHGRDLLNTHLHTLLIYTIGLNAIATITEFIFRHKFIWSIPRLFFLWLQGTWFYQVAFILFNPTTGGPTLDVHDSESVMVATLYYAGHILLATAGHSLDIASLQYLTQNQVKVWHLVQFIIGGVVYLCHGRPKPVHDYMVLKDISSSNSSNHTSTTSRRGSGSDNELWEETSKLMNTI